MCGRFTLAANTEQIQESFSWLNVPEAIEPRYNIAPTQPVAVVPNDGKNTLDYFIWGLVPSWAKDPEIGNRMINARAETIAEKPAFRAAFRRRRCLILSDGFYEWRKLPGKSAKIPMYIRLKDGQPFAFAGIWEVWNSADGSKLLTCSIITTRPNELVASIHNRMPVILPRDQLDTWLTPGEVEPEALQGLLEPYPQEELTAFPVSTIVNNPRNETPECIAPLVE